MQDVLTGCCRKEVRTSAADMLKKLASIVPPSPSIEQPKYFILKAILEARLPYWISNVAIRGNRQVRLLISMHRYPLSSRANMTK